MKAVYTLSDLSKPSELNPPGLPPARLAVIGHPIAHSQSPQLHQPALDALGIETRYIRLELQPGELPTALQKMRELDFIGINVTVPYKFEALKACSTLDPVAQALGVVNTILLHKNGETLGFNTDGPGFVKAIHEDFSAHIRDMKIMIIGAGGGAGQALATQCASESCQQLILVNRSVDKIETLATRISPLFSKERTKTSHQLIETIPLDSPRLIEMAHRCDLIVQTSSLGLKDNDSSPIAKESLKPHHLVYDTIYEPSRTQFLKDAQDIGARTSNGLSLLLHQGALSFQHWFPKSDPLTHMRSFKKNS